MSTALKRLEYSLPILTISSLFGISMFYKYNLNQTYNAMPAIVIITIVLMALVGFKNGHPKTKILWIFAITWTICWTLMFNILPGVGFTTQFEWVATSFIIMTLLFIPESIAISFTEHKSDYKKIFLVVHYTASLLFLFFWPAKKNVGKYFLLAGLPFLIAVFCDYRLRELAAIKDCTTIKLQNFWTWLTKKGHLLIYAILIVGPLLGFFLGKFFYNKSLLTKIMLGKWEISVLFISCIITCTGIVYIIAYGAPWLFKKLKSKRIIQGSSPNRKSMKTWVERVFKRDNIVAFIQILVTAGMIATMLIKPSLTFILWFFPIVGWIFFKLRGTKEVRADRWHRGFNILIYVYSVVLAPYGIYKMFKRRIIERLNKNTWGVLRLTIFSTIFFVLLLIALMATYIGVDSYYKGSFSKTLKSVSLSSISEYTEKKRFGVAFLPHINAIKKLPKKVKGTKFFSWLLSAKEIKKNYTPSWIKAKKAKKVKKLVKRRKSTSRPAVPRRRAIKRRKIVPRKRAIVKERTYKCLTVKRGTPNNKLQSPRGHIRWNLKSAKKYARLYRSKLKKAFVKRVLEGNSEAKTYLTPYFLFEIGGKPVILFIPPSNEVMKTTQRSGYHSKLATPVYRYIQRQNKPCK